MSYLQYQVQHKNCCGRVLTISLFSAPIHHVLGQLGISFVTNSVSRVSQPGNDTTINFSRFENWFGEQHMATVQISKSTYNHNAPCEPLTFIFNFSCYYSIFGPNTETGQIVFERYFTFPLGPNVANQPFHASITWRLWYSPKKESEYSEVCIVFSYTPHCEVYNSKRVVWRVRWSKCMPSASASKLSCPFLGVPGRFYLCEFPCRYYGGTSWTSSAPCGGGN